MILIKVLTVLLLIELNSALHCGDNNLRLTKIIDGKDAKKHEFPWQAALQWATTMSKGDHMCGGSLIHMKYVLTAAHCFAHGADPEYYNVILGGHNRETSDKLQQTMKIKTITLHEAYNAKTFDNDIALIELERPVRFSPAVNTICLPSFTDFERKAKDCVISGWGKTKDDDDTLPSILQKAKVPVVKSTTCRQTYKQLTLNMFCAGYKDGSMDACTGDSGGPLQCKEDVTGFYRLQGITSFGDGCGQAGKYGVYTVVRHYLQWIRTHSKGAIKPPMPKPPSPPKPPVPGKPSIPKPPVPEKPSVPKPPIPGKPTIPRPPVPKPPVPSILMDSLRSKMVMGRWKRNSWGSNSTSTVHTNSTTTNSSHTNNSTEASSHHLTEQPWARWGGHSWGNWDRWNVTEWNHWGRHRHWGRWTQWGRHRPSPRPWRTRWPQQSTYRPSGRPSISWKQLERMRAILAAHMNRMQSHIKHILDIAETGFYHIRGRIENTMRAFLGHGGHH